MSVALKTPLINKALAQPQSFGLLQLMRIINRQLANSAEPFELVIAADPIPNNSSDQVSEFILQQKQALITTSKSSLTSGNAAVPPYIIETLLAAFHQQDYALHDFLNILNDRYFKLYARTVEKSHLLLTDEVDRYFNRENHPQKPQRALASCIAQLTGLPESDETKNWLGYSLMLGRPNRSQRDLQQVLADYFDLNITISCTKLSKHQLSPDNWTRLGTDSHSGDRSIPEQNSSSQPQNRIEYQSQSRRKNTGQNNQLGHGFLLGQRCWLAKQKINITITPDNVEQLQMLSRESGWYQELAKMSRYYFRDKTTIAIFLKAPDTWFAKTRLSVKAGETLCLGRGFHLQSSTQNKTIVYLIHLVKD